MEHFKDDTDLSHTLFDLWNIAKEDFNTIEYVEGESKKRLKLQLHIYMCKLQNRKIKQANAECDLSERLQKFDEVRRTWPKLIPPRMKERLVSDFKRAMSSGELASFTCACCARELLLKERQAKNYKDLNIDMLCRPNVAETNTSVHYPHCLSQLVHWQMYL